MLLCSYSITSFDLQQELQVQYIWNKMFCVENLGKRSVSNLIMCIFNLFLNIDVFFDVDSKSTIGFWRSHVAS